MTTSAYWKDGAGLMLTVGQEYSPAIEINVGHRAICAMKFSANGGHLVSCDEKGVQVWQVEDGTQIAVLAAKDVQCLAVSKDGRWIAGGTRKGELVMWDAKTREKVLTHEDNGFINAVDFSPDSTRLLVASLWTSTAIIWDVATRTRAGVGPLHHKSWVRAAKYSPQGDRIATATEDGVRVYDSSDGRLLADIPMRVTRWLDNTGLYWSKNRLFIVSDSGIKQIEPSTGSPVSECPVYNTHSFLCILLPQHGDFIACSTDHTVLFFELGTSTQLGLTQHTQVICSIAFSQNNQFLAIGGEGGKITIKNLRDILPLYNFTVPFIDISDTVLDSWKQDRLADTEASLTRAITSSTHPSHHTFASRALVRARLGHWSVAIDDAEKSINIQPSVVAYIAKSVALVGRGNKREGCQVFDFVFRHCDPIHVDLLLLTKAVVLFMAGERDGAVSRVGALITEAPINSTFHVVQAYMYLLLGNEHVERSDYQRAIQSFEHARDQMRYYVGLPIFISLISGWKCDDIGITIQQRLCEALYAAGHTKEGGKSLLTMVNTFDEKVYVSGPITKWVSDFTRRCLSADGDLASKAARRNEVTMPHVTLNSTTTMPLLREWAKSTLVGSLWKDAMVTALSFTLPRFAICRVICERLETIDHVTDAIECLSELAGEKDMHGEEAKWVLEFKQRCAEKLACFGDAAADAQRHNDAIIQYSTALSLNPARPQDFFIKRSKEYVAKWSWEDALADTSQVIMLDPFSPWGYESVLTEWAKVKLTDESWRDALTTAVGFTVPRLMIYRAICERLEMVDRIMDATECVHEMANELAQEIQGEEVKWVLDFKSRCCGKLEGLEDTAMNTRQYDEAISQYSATLSLNPTIPQALFVKRSEARAARCLWEDALSDANEA
ncbi:WD40-repeat-containing domain protein [Butyriboletus roseoflavus]|nr:WD40-repeat-containing domain protein [Butyriboletus roseoflavus]